MKFLFYNGTDGVYRLITASISKMGGAAKLQLQLAKALVANGHEVIVVTPVSKDEVLLLSIDGIKFYPSSRHTISLELIKILIDERPDWFYWHTNSIHIGICFFIAKILGIRTIYAVASDKDCNPRLAINPFTFKKYFWVLYKFGLDLADRIFIQHNTQRDMLGFKYKGKIFLVNNIMELPEFSTSNHKKEFLIWLANIRIEKRPDLLLEIARKMPQQKFRMYGAVIDYRSEIGYGENILNQLESISNISYHGSLKPENVLSTLSEASIFLSTSDQEGFPNTMLESWSVGVPVISLKLDIGGTIEQNQIGYVTKDIDETVSRISHLMNNPIERIQLGQNGVNYVRSNHSVLVVYNQVINAIKTDNKAQSLYKVNDE